MRGGRGRRALWLALPVLAALAGCQDVPGVDPAVADPAAVCLRRLQDYDRAVLFYSSTDWGRGQVLAPQVMQAAQAARETGCVTDAFVTDGLARALPAFAAAPRGEHGAPIPRTWLQVGVAGGINAEIQSRQFFAALGYPVRSRGAPGLGRRVFIGPFATEGGLGDAIALARDAGFVAPYPRRF